MSARILVVDDEPFNLDIIVETLDAPGYEVATASSGEEAWRALQAADAHFDLVVLDRMMSGMDGLEVLRRMKADARLQAIPVVMQTAAASPEQVREGLAAGAHYYLTKPFALEALQTIVRAALDDAAQRRALVERLGGQARVLRLVESACFRVRTIDEAQQVAALLGQLLAAPELGAMGLSELLVNGVEHGNLGIDFAEKTRLREADCWHEEIERRGALPENQDKTVSVTLSRAGDAWEFVIEDEGEGFDWTRFLELAPERAFAPNGRGIALARQAAFLSMDYEGTGNRVRVRARGVAARFQRL